MANPNPDLITNEMWRLWTDRPTFSWKLGGIYADKEGYHNTVNANLKHWPDNYSIRTECDLVRINRNKARAIDLTMSDSEMVKWTSRMKKAALDPYDRRLDAVREFYGTLDNETVYGLIKDGTGSNWRVSTADSTHLWHGHVSIFTEFVDNWSMLSPLLSVWRGEPNLGLAKMFLPKLNETSQDVKYWQAVHNAIRNTTTPPLPALEGDGTYGPKMAAGITEFYKRLGGVGTYKGEYLTGWMAMKYQEYFIRLSSPKPTNSAIDPEKLKELVNQWLLQNVPSNLNLTATLKGKVALHESDGS